MKIVVFGLTISSSWGNGHATLWRGLCRALAARGHRVVFYEQDVPYYAMNRDLLEVPGGDLVLYGEWQGIRPRAAKDLRDADVAMVTSYCPDGLEATDLVLGAKRPLFCATWSFARFHVASSTRAGTACSMSPLAWCCPWRSRRLSSTSARVTGRRSASPRSPMRSPS